MLPYIAAPWILWARKILKQQGMSPQKPVIISPMDVQFYGVFFQALDPPRTWSMVFADVAG